VITPFGLRHIRLLRELQSTSVLLDPRNSLLDVPPTPLRAALRGYLLRNSGVSTYVLHAPDEAIAWCGFVQAQAFKSGLAWKVACMAPALDTSEDAATVWYRLLLHLCIAAGEQHVQRLFACVPQDGPVEEVFRQASFAVYCHEQVFECADNRASRRPSARMRLAQPQDYWNVQRLYHIATPPLVEQAEQLGNTDNTSPPFEMPALDSQQLYVLYSQSGEMSGCLQIATGDRGSWLRLTVHPEMRDDAAEILDHGLALLSAGSPLPSAGASHASSTAPSLLGKGRAIDGGGACRPVYCAVREYEAGMQALLEERGFVFADACSLVAKHTTVHVRAPHRKLVPVLEKRAGVAPTVVSHSESGGRWEWVAREPS
jgi:hypothetical protein